MYVFNIMFYKSIYFQLDTLQHIFLWDFRLMLILGTYLNHASQQCPLWLDQLEDVLLFESTLRTIKEDRGGKGDVKEDQPPWTHKQATYKSGTSQHPTKFNTLYLNFILLECLYYWSNQPIFWWGNSSLITVNHWYGSCKCTYQSWNRSLTLKALNPSWSLGKKLVCFLHTGMY